MNILEPRVISLINNTGLRSQAIPIVAARIKLYRIKHSAV